MKVDQAGLKLHHVLGEGWIHTHGMQAHDLPELEVRGVPGFLLIPAGDLLRQVCEYMLVTGKVVRAGETMKVGPVRVRFAEPVPQAGHEDHYRHPRLEVLDAGQNCECCGMLEVA